MTTSTAQLVAALRPLLAAEAAAEAPAAGIEAADLEQAVWLRLLERETGPDEPARWVRSAVRTEARIARRRTRREAAYHALGAGTPEPATGHDSSPERRALDGERHRELRAAVGRLPGRCPELLGAMLSPDDPTYREIAGELGISQGSLGPVRSRCLGCLRRMLRAEVAAPELGGKEP
ncbi:sigma-70 family RNA polymerase sigma factor [Streptomyces sp. A3M-1-3]|uniref:sigma-70 family RNA polymerase sigma factor n=1 Tax=Streptomyces sp. A3M-1-3 TaxID=2962044 RepID=UPI0020B741D2|nr:sigma-70 family RNA polymerase sigma factor [Streptomyces sp. A3M-1-3]MCP3817119.1 sigma-70 family RNA polymerase sigma factor [Streptomyces sp. A3M-1-3]